jgi:hypothetical protein
MLFWLLGGVAVLTVLAIMVIRNAEADDKLRRQAPRKSQ